MTNVAKLASASVDDHDQEGDEQAAARVLVAEDDARVRRLIGRMLRRSGFEVIEAVDGQEALELARESEPDIAIIDLRMPRLDGFSVIKGLKADNANRPVIVLSGMDDAEDRVRAFDLGADDFVPKPVHVQELLKRVGAFERNRRAYIAVKKANARADRLRLFASEAAALLAHDLNNGLQIAGGNIQFLHSELADHADEDIVDAMVSAVQALRRMTGLVNNFVDISRLEDAALEPSRRTTDVTKLLRSLARMHEGGVVNTKLLVDADDGVTAEIDPMLLERVIHNLLNNATRYVSKGGAIVLRCDVVHEVDRFLVVGVGNTGNPIPRELREGLFDKYRKGRDGRAQRGMGLYFCSLACAAHGGRIELSDDPTYATYFKISLPF